MNSSMELRNLQLEVARLQAENRQCSDFMSESKKKGEEILYYQDSLELIKREVEHLNQTLHSRNNEYHLVCEEAELVKSQNAILNADKSDLTRVMTRGMEMLADMCRILGIELPVKTEDQLEQVRTTCEGVTKMVKGLQDECTTLANVNADVRKEYSDKLIKEKEKSVKLEYQKKLLEDRKLDNDRQAELKAADEKDRRIESL